MFRHPSKDNPYDYLTTVQSRSWRPCYTMPRVVVTLQAKSEAILGTAFRLLIYIYNRGFHTYEACSEAEARGACCPEHPCQPRYIPSVRAAVRDLSTSPPWVCRITCSCSQPICPCQVDKLGYSPPC